MTKDNFTCKQCGLCCRKTNPKTWELAVLTDEEKSQLIAEFEKYPMIIGQVYCEALGYDSEGWFCVIEKILGQDKKPNVCKNYPADGQLCEMEKENNGS